MSYLNIFRAVRKYWWMVIVALLVTMGAATVLTQMSPKKYETGVTFFVQTPSDQLSVAAQGDTFGQKRVNSYVQLIDTDMLLKPVLADTGLAMSTAELAGELKASGDPNTVLLTVTVTDGSPQRSQLIAASVIKQFVKVVADLESASSTGGVTVRLELVSGPSFNPNPVSPRPLLNYALAGLLGLILGMGAAILRDVLDTTLRSAADVETGIGASVIGTINFDAAAKRDPLIIDSHAQSVRAEAFRQLRTNLDFVNVGKPAKTIVITSSVPDEGKSTTATNLAVVFAEAGKLVLLVEADLRRPRVAQYLGIEGAVGLTNVLASQVSLSEALQPWGRAGMTILPSGSIPPNPSEMLGSSAMVTLLGKLAQQFDVILIDTPPLLPVTDAAILAAHADGAILVVRHGRTTRSQAAIARSSLEKVGAPLLGAVLNMSPPRGPDSYGYGYSYQTNADRSALTLSDEQAQAAPGRMTAGPSRHIHDVAGEPKVLLPAEPVR